MNRQLIIRELRASNFMRFESIEVAFGEGGVVVTGANEQGKTTVLRLLLMVLTARGISPDALRLKEDGTRAEKAVLELDLGHMSVRRILRRSGKNELEVRIDGGPPEKAPQTLLDELFGKMIDPLKIYLAKPDERVELIARSLPLTVTREDLARWVTRADLLPETWSTAGHAFDVIERTHEHVYDVRKTANAKAKTAEEESKVERKKLDARRAQLPADVPASTEAVRNELETARTELAGLEARDLEATRAQREISNANETARKCREDADRAIASVPADPPTVVELDELSAREKRLAETVADLEAKLAAARQEHDQVRRLHATRLDVCRNHTRAHERANALREQASTLEALAKRMAPEPVSAAQIDEARDRLADLQISLSAAEARDVMDREAARVEALEASAAALRTEASKLTEIVDALRERAPVELLLESAQIPGLEIEGKTIRLDGISMDGLSGMKELRFATLIAKRAQRDCDLKLLVVDGLERLDPVQYEAFLHDATDGGWQLIATRVDQGPLVVSRIEGGVS